MFDATSNSSTMKTTADLSDYIGTTSSSSSTTTSTISTSTTSSSGGNTTRQISGSSDENGGFTGSSKFFFIIINIFLIIWHYGQPKYFDPLIYPVVIKGICSKTLALFQGCFSLRFHQKKVVFFKNQILKYSYIGAAEFNFIIQIERKIHGRVNLYTTCMYVFFGQNYLQKIFTNSKWKK